ncbi:unnamed protein product [Adineta ricciae]|uniref:Uncharacterized protein n=1 Tax=Adineta ricciae TaxID=249248 RepID=A0A814PKC5_ADIRI|nr:unnamed protein product [Adineta ricciae]
MNISSSPEKERAAQLRINHLYSHSHLCNISFLSIAKQDLVSGQSISTPLRCSHSSSDLSLNHVLQEKSDIHHLTNSPNTFETSITSNSSLSSASNKHHDTLSYLIDQNQRTMQRLITSYQVNSNEESTTMLSSASIRIPDYESGQLLTTISHENTQLSRAQQKSILIETGFLSTVDFPSALLHAEGHHVFETVELNSKIDGDDHGILDEPSLALLSNSYRSSTTIAMINQIVNEMGTQSRSQQKKKQCSSPLSTCDDKTSACSTPALSLIKNEPIATHETMIRSETNC